ncbi:glycosyltransferase family 2 protein [Polynucleobacter sphagniphilus]|uniref:glycosyltransferase family 2 protein n=1 Tax=Polynucleobacter sphagniphilus TaxID=1743169 RepID=UPI002474992A|nr:glycosyltransferase family 2 protein [Polynucleobacter sphagniphilus]MDH6525642.1 glycosyltransferase involved in cell wall biosynthesis [Polynucleobacter sphagniphilus]
MKLCIVIPYYNHPDAIGAVVKQLLPSNLNIIIVDDGSSADSKKILIPLLQSPQVSLVTRILNGGKGAAVIAGMREALNQGYTHALQVDADGQHDLSKIPELIKLSEENPEMIISGMPVYDDSVPTNRKLWRYATHILVWIHTLSFEIKDSMCGFRIYPLRKTLEVIDSREKFGQRMDFDIEVLVRALWADLHIKQLPVAVRYPIDGVSHFQLFNDNFLITKMHFRLFFGMLMNSPKLLCRKSVA